MEALNKFLADLPIATLIALGSIIGGLIALGNGSITFTEFQVGIGASSLGAGVLGAARVNAAKTDVPNKVTE